MFKYCSRNDIGVSHNTNDDKFMINDVIIEDGDYKGRSENYISAILCDGVSGELEGNRAALETLKNLKGIVKENLTKEEVIEKIEETNTLIRKIQRDENKEKGLKTTLVGVYSNKNIFIYYNLGDSRAYRYRNGYFQRLTRDDSKVQDMIDNELISEEEAMHYPQRNIINNCIGYSDTCKINIYSSNIALREDDIIFLCSDGITDVIDDDTLKVIFDKRNSIEETLNEIYSLSLKNKSKDNISLIIIKKEDYCNE
ncbi:PP2C family protein-serine/threonine phosphatase [Fusobacterium animalis]|uniref:PP2C family protein-serine/threonine phosphatase n=1 Tax=Fusobacterium animalis TaxID=76859 RepID=UPI0034DEAA62